MVSLDVPVVDVPVIPVVDIAVVDVHCHTFNASDVPVRGFIERVVGQRSALLAALAPAVDRAFQGAASGAEEIEELDRLLASEPGATREGVQAGVPLRPQIRAEAADLVRELEPDLARRADEEAAEDRRRPRPTVIDEPGGDDGPEMDDAPGLVDLQRYLEWVLLFGQRRLELTIALTEVYGGVALFTPLLVDFRGLGDAPRTSVEEQLQMQERISRLSLLGRLGSATILPFVGFDPRAPEALGVVQRAVHSLGCFGVKLYPPMGFLPIGNADRPPLGMSPEEAARVEETLGAFFDWCTSDDVPVTAHGNPSIAADETFLDFSAPQHWEQVLLRWPDLRLNLAHFGWSAWDVGWPQQISSLTARFPNLYADLGDQEPKDLAETVERLDVLYSDPETATVRDRVMYGSDWYMAARHAGFEGLLDLTREAYAARFGDLESRFLGGAALSFLGFDDAANHNRQRLVNRCAALGVEPPVWLPQTG